MADPGETRLAKRQKLLACQRCRYRKQKCTEERPCENCIQSGTQSASSKLALEPDYVQRLEERVAQLESLVPQESLDHIHTRPPDEPATSRIRTTPNDNSPGRHLQGPGSAHSRDDDHRTRSSRLEWPSNQEFSLINSNLMPTAQSTLDSLGSHLFEAITGIPTQHARREEPTPEALDLDSDLERFLIQTYFEMAHSQYPLLLRHEFLGWADSWRRGKRACPPEEQWKGFMVYSIAFLMAKRRINGPMRSEHRRRVFWCAYGIDRAICSTYDLPSCISDSYITVPIFDNIDDNTLLDISTSTESQSIEPVTSPTNVSPALYVLVGRQIESEIQDMMLHKDYSEHSDAVSAWRVQISERLKEWDRDSAALSHPSQTGYTSSRWLKMIYYYNIVTLYRPTRGMAQGVAGDLSVQACCHALLLFRRFQMAREIAKPWLGIGVTLLYCFYATPIALWRPSYKSADVPDAIRACSSTLAIMADRWTEAECLRDVFDILARELMSAAGRRNILEENWQQMSEIVIHRSTLRMIREMATECFVSEVELGNYEQLHPDAGLDAEAAVLLIDAMDLQWVNAAHPPPLEMGQGFSYFQL
ncbi:uncharacterized protein NECHADRAFT_88944 [Fusarium vanettenii 77-13-4]|uniref:Zn(2)-C6 fungal-type domain-containing protein n=1 Tax=Fusarium vanettenii (strain ATCC MYA-4622 / CBS 123669 / FGSC 9596 / NRRL 45880 / 77-13-4) TaxID=660122 RepID=C7ZGS4_FUSV7|nr:uncharacterized protein NECHADRAFT_88944 [Fusarium vanettenii 77-13-4]EEU36782.1 predicted protein [Fusarium vanettenii 77-13-4]